MKNTILLLIALTFSQMTQAEDFQFSGEILEDCGQHDNYGLTDQANQQELIVKQQAQQLEKK